MTDVKLELHGGCICGDIRYQVISRTEPRQHVLCHCPDCRKITGTGHSQTVGVPAEDVEWTGSGTPNVYKTTSALGNRVENGFCGRCGAPVFRRFKLQRTDLVAARGDIIAFHAGSLDAACIDQYSPDFKIWLRHRPAWDQYV